MSIVRNGQVKVNTHVDPHLTLCICYISSYVKTSPKEECECTSLSSVPHPSAHGILPAHAEISYYSAKECVSTPPSPYAE